MGKMAIFFGGFINICRSEGSKFSNEKSRIRINNTCGLPTVQVTSTGGCPDFSVMVLCSLFDCFPLQSRMTLMSKPNQGMSQHTKKNTHNSTIPVSQTKL